MQNTVELIPPWDVYNPSYHYLLECILDRALGTTETSDSPVNLPPLDPRLEAPFQYNEEVWQMQNPAISQMSTFFPSKRVVKAQKDNLKVTRIESEGLDLDALMSQAAVLNETEATTSQAAGVAVQQQEQDNEFEQGRQLYLLPDTFAALQQLSLDQINEALQSELCPQNQLVQSFLSHFKGAVPKTGLSYMFDKLVNQIADLDQLTDQTWATLKEQLGVFFISLRQLNEMEMFKEFQSEIRQLYVDDALDENVYKKLNEWGLFTSVE